MHVRLQDPLRVLEPTYMLGAVGPVPPPSVKVPFHYVDNGGYVLHIAACGRSRLDLN